MPILIDTEDIYENESESLKLELNLNSLKIYEDNTSEGWIYYDINLRNGKKNLARAEGAMLDGDVRFLEKIFTDLPAKPSDFAPIEPDFELNIKYIEAKEDWELTCMINHGEVLHQYYGTSAIGFRILISKVAAQKFASELKTQRIAITKDIDFTGAVSKHVKM